jgi:hypothetical protein
MALQGKIPSIIHLASQANLTGYTYYEVIGGGVSGGTATINGTIMNIPSSINFGVVVRTISGVTGDVYLGGDPINVSYGSSIIGGSFTGNQ